MSNNQISEHEIRVYEAVREAGGWQSAREIAVRADVADRTSRHHAANLAGIGLFEQAKVFGGFRYRIKAEPAPVAVAYRAEIEAAKRAFSS